jgi:radical SAM superfamily enzyme YgiQ (UPF0313 family)
MISISSAQYSYKFGNRQIHLPYSIASLASYALGSQYIKAACVFDKVFLDREGVEEHIHRGSKSDVLLCSTYSWNWSISCHLAQEIKKENPECLIIFGGPQVPESHRPENESFFATFPFIDLIVHGEGETVLREVLERYLAGDNVAQAGIPGTQSQYCLGPPQPRITELDIISSPYSSDLIWDLVDRDAFNYVASWETNRGCPFQCTFCDWGSATKSRIRRFSESKLNEEIDWFGRNKIGYVEVCDGNFGIYADHDLRLAKRLARTKKITSSPDRINLTWVKASSEKILPIARVLNKAGMLRAVSLSVQSLDDATLKIIKRRNIRFDKFSDLIKKFASEGIQTYTELILSLPGETVASFKENWETMAQVYPLPAILVWNCSVFVNAPMNDPSYKERYQMQVFDSPMFMQHSVSNRGDQFPEFEKMVKGTLSMTTRELIEVFAFNWIMLVMHAFGLTELIARYFFLKKGLPFVSFYERLALFAMSNPESLLGREYLGAIRHAEKGYGGAGWGQQDESLGEITWPIEEASWLRLVRSGERWEKEIREFVYVAYVKDASESERGIIEDLVNFQCFLINRPGLLTNVEGQFSFNWEPFFSQGEALCHFPHTSVRRPAILEEDPVQWGYETAWFGRRNQRHTGRVEEIEQFPNKSFDWLDEVIRQ